MNVLTSEWRCQTLVSLHRAAKMCYRYQCYKFRQEVNDVTYYSVQHSEAKTL